MNNALKLETSETSTKLNAYSLITALKSAQEFAAKKDARYYLVGVCLKPIDGGVRVMSSNGHLACQIDIDAPEWSLPEMILALDTVKQLTALKIAARDRMKMPLEITETVVTCNGVSIALNKHDTRWPDVERVIEMNVKAESKTAVRTISKGINAHYLMQLGKAAEYLAHPKYNGTEIIGGCDSGHALCLKVPTNHGEFPNISKDAYFVVMPMRM